MKLCNGIRPYDDNTDMSRANVSTFKKNTRNEKLNEANGNNNNKQMKKKHNKSEELFIERMLRCKLVV